MYVGHLLDASYSRGWGDVALSWDSQKPPAGQAVLAVYSKDEETGARQ